MHYIITEIQEDGTKTTICGYGTMQEAIEAARNFYEYERRQLRYVVDQVKEEPHFGESVIKIQNVWDSTDILPWE